VATDADRLHLLYEMSRRLATFSRLDELLRFVTRRTRELLEAEGCALLLHDRDRKELYFPIASQAESHPNAAAVLAEIRFPADRGIAGWVLAHDEAVYIADAQRDPRFYEAVDRRTNMTTRDLLCAPLRTRSGNIGVIEVINPGSTGAGTDTLEFLEVLAGDIAIAHEKAMLYERLRGEVLELRRIFRTAGIGLAVLGILIVLGAVYTHLGWALPMRELPTRPGVVIGAACVVGWALLMWIARGALTQRTDDVTG
jgi:GAF domain-containing protein